MEGKAVETVLTQKGEDFIQQPKLMKIDELNQILIKIINTSQI